MTSKENTHKLYNFAALIQSDSYVDNDPWESYDVQGICPPGWKVNSWYPAKSSWAITEMPLYELSSLPRMVNLATPFWETGYGAESIAKTTSPTVGAHHIRNVVYLPATASYQAKVKNQERRWSTSGGGSGQSYYLYCGSAMPTRCWTR